MLTSTALSESGESGRTCLGPNFKEKVYSFTTKLNVNFSSTSGLPKSFHHLWVLNFVRSFFLYIDDDFSSFVLLAMVHHGGDSNIEVFLHSWGKKLIWS